MALMDALGRPLQSLRISLTDRCNLRCQYCMPEQEYDWLPGKDFLTFDELTGLAKLFVSVGVRRIRLTGGEPLLRPRVAELVRKLRGIPDLEDLALTTNGILLAEQASNLVGAGLQRLTVSLDTLKPDRFFYLTRRDRHEDVLRGIEAASNAGFGELKIDSVIMRGINEDELVPLIEFGTSVGAEVRFIEYMDVAGATKWSKERVFSKRDMLEQLSQRFGPIEPIDKPFSAPAERFRSSDGHVFGIIASTTSPFCKACDRSRLSADGIWFTCLYATSGIDLGRKLRASGSLAEIQSTIMSAWPMRRDRGAEERLALGKQRQAISAAEFRSDPHLEMHARGG